LTGAFAVTTNATINVILPPFHQKNIFERLWILNIEKFLSTSHLVQIRNTYKRSRCKNINYHLLEPAVFKLLLNVFGQHWEEKLYVIFIQICSFFHKFIFEYHEVNSTTPFLSLQELIRGILRSNKKNRSFMKIKRKIQFHELDIW
jgi:hypothetical protein